MPGTGKRATILMLKDTLAMPKIRDIYVDSAGEGKRESYHGNTTYITFALSHDAKREFSRQIYSPTDVLTSTRLNQPQLKRKHLQKHSRKHCKF